jgi:hypothetical protein
MRGSALKKAGISEQSRLRLAPKIDVYTIDGGARAIESMQCLLNCAEQLDGWPLLLGKADNLQLMQEPLQTDVAAEGWLSQADAWRDLDVQQVLRAVKLAELEHLRTYNREHPANPAPEMILKLAEERTAYEPKMPPFNSTDWPKEPPNQEFGIHCLFDPIERVFYKEVLLAIVECPSTDVAAYLHFGGFNACPPPSAHVALARVWKQKFGAHPIAITNDTLEFFVERPPGRPEDAWQLAWEQESYSEENLGAADLKSFAQKLWNRPHWLFWWD